jgi:hypothetical protein
MDINKDIVESDCLNFTDDGRRMLIRSVAALKTAGRPVASRWIRSLRYGSTSQRKTYVGAGILNPNFKKDKLEDVQKVLVIGSGGLSIGQAGEFDYSGE